MKVSTKADETLDLILIHPLKVFFQYLKVLNKISLGMKPWNPLKELKLLAIDWIYTYIMQFDKTIHINWKHIILFSGQV